LIIYVLRVEKGRAALRLCLLARRDRKTLLLK
jgi:hypothetical protein